jgi:hypothetical protein
MSAVSRLAIAYDGVRQRTVLFNDAGQGFFCDTWKQFFRTDVGKPEP